MTMTSMKVVSPGAKPTTMNLAVGNYTGTIKHAGFGYFAGEDNFKQMLNNITGSAKGRLIIKEDTYLEANNITGLTMEFTGNGKGLHIYESTENTAFVRATGNVSIKRLEYKDSAAAILNVRGKLTTDGILLKGKNHVEITIQDINPIQIKGTQEIVEGVKITDSVIAVKEGESITEEIILNLYSYTGQKIPSGTKVITGKYLNPNDWDVNSNWMGDSGKNELYYRGADLYLGNTIE